MRVSRHFYSEFPTWLVCAFFFFFPPSFVFLFIYWDLAPSGWGWSVGCVERVEEAVHPGDEMKQQVVMSNYYLKKRTIRKEAPGSPWRCGEGLWGTFPLNLSCDRMNFADICMRNRFFFFFPRYIFKHGLKTSWMTNGPIPKHVGKEDMRGVGEPHRGAPVRAWVLLPVH